MGHQLGKDVYRALGGKIDGAMCRAPWNDRLRALLEELYSPEEADFVARMPYSFSSIGAVKSATGASTDELSERLESLCDKGLVIDLEFDGRTYYQPSPMVVGIFEFTMMRTRGQLATKEWAKLLQEYMHGDASFYSSNAGRLSIMRSLDDAKKLRKNGRPIVDESICLGCGVCTRHCKPESLKLHHRTQRVLHPETTFERVLLTCLERGTLQNQLFSDPNSKSQSFMRGVVGGFLRLPPVKQALMSDLLRSRFLAAITAGARSQGRGSITEV